MKLFLKVAPFTVVMPGTRGPSPVVRQVRLQETQDLPDDIARGGAVVGDVEGVRPGRMVDEGHGPIVADGPRQERIERGVQPRKLVPTRASHK